MRDKTRVNRVVVKKIVGYCDDIKDYMNQVNATYEVYLANKMFRTAVDMSVLQIGELTKRLSDDFKARHSEIPWNQVKGMRNVLVHEYEEVDFETAWNILTKRIPELKAQLEKILEAEGGLNDSQI